MMYTISVLVATNQERSLEKAQQTAAIYDLDDEINRGGDEENDGDVDDIIYDSFDDDDDDDDDGDGKGGLIAVDMVNKSLDDNGGDDKSETSKVAENVGEDSEQISTYGGETRIKSYYDVKLMSYSHEVGSSSQVHRVW
ncbi:hypothetical protein HanPSC8_Chr16g0720001 [Helianthus annuus]|nr:hypothetical protein HanPSC8_Chr16g0720001 [Helianthus annuus]